MTPRIPVKYVPRHISSKDKRKQWREVMTSRRLYKRHIYHTRPKLASFASKKSSHVQKAKHMYGVNSISASTALSKATGCSTAALAKIIRKGEGAYYSSGSRPNQTAQSWGIARLASSITSGKSAAVDFNILQEGCRPGSRALSLAKRARKKHGHGTRKVPKIKI
jgi:hypothetical protein